MKTILILSYYYPPANLTPSERVFSFAKYLRKKGYEPIIVCRDWSEPINSMHQAYSSSGNKVQMKEEDGIKTYYVPYKSNFAQRAFIKYSGTKLYPVYLALSFISQVLDTLSSHFTGLIPLYEQCKKVISENEIDLLIVSASPFHLFKFGYKIKKQFNIPWIADYRDDWNTNELFKDNFVKRIVQSLSKSTEKKWLSNASFFTSVSNFYVQKIESLINRKGYTIENGYLKDNYIQLPPYKSQDQFVITYIGSLYHSQPIEIFIQGVTNFIKENENSKLHVQFVGLASQKEALQRVQQKINGYEKYFSFSNRVPKTKALELQLNSSLLLICAHNKLKGTPGSKLYEYIAFKKPVLICPSDEDIIKETLTKTGQGIITEDASSLSLFLEKAYQHWQRHGDINNLVNIQLEEVEQFSREKIANKLIEIAQNENLL